MLEIFANFPGSCHEIAVAQNRQNVLFYFPRYEFPSHFGQVQTTHKKLFAYEPTIQVAQVGSKIDY